MEPSDRAHGDTRSKSRRRVVYRRSAWCVQQFEVTAGGGVLCQVAALRVAGALLVWLGSGAPVLGVVALGVPSDTGPALATALAGAGPEADAAAGLARRLAAALARPVHVCCGATFDRFTAPLVERGLITEIKSRPEFL